MRLPSRDLAPTLALLVTVLVSAMDVTIVSTVMPTIVGELGGLALYSWGFAAYLLTSTTTLPVYGKLADLYGRKPLYLTAMAVFLLGSLLCGLATSIEALIAFRAVQGLGAGGLLTISTTLAGDLYPLEERPKIQAAMSTVWGLASIVGPVLGSAIVSQASWRWVFWINLPIGLVATGVLGASLHEHLTPTRHHVDYAGVVLLTAGLGAVLGALVEAGQAGFASPGVSALLALGALLLGLLAWVEAGAAEPVVPIRLLRDRVQGLASVAALALGACIFSASTYLPLLVQGAQGGTAYDVAWVTAAVSLAWTGGSVAAGPLLGRLGFRPAALGGMAILTASGLLLPRLALETPLAIVVAVGVVIGFGLGLASTPLIVLVQSVVGWERRGVATAAQQFFRSIGGTVWVSVQGAVLSAAAASAVASAAVAALAMPSGARAGERGLPLGELNALLDPATRATLPPEQVGVLATVLADSLQPVFWLFLLAAVVGLVAIALLPRGPLVATIEVAPPAPQSWGEQTNGSRKIEPTPSRWPEMGSPGGREGAPP